MKPRVVVPLRLNKTEVAILAELKIRGTYSATWASGRGQQGGHIQGGKRQYEACKSLVRMKLATQVGDVLKEDDTRHGRTVSYRSITINQKEALG